MIEETDVRRREQGGKRRGGVGGLQGFERVNWGLRLRGKGGFIKIVLFV